MLTDGDSYRLPALNREVRRLQTEAADEASRHFFVELGDALHNRDVVKEAASDVLYLLPKKNMPYVAEFMVRAFTALELTENPAFQPDSFRQTFDRIEDEFQYGQFVTFAMFNILSNIHGRGAPLKFLLRAYQLTESIDILELGSSGNLIGKKLVAGTPYEPATIVERRSEGNNRLVFPDEQFSWHYNRVVNQPQDIRRVIGVDIFNPDERRVKLFREASSFYLGERYNEEKLAEYKHLNESHPGNVTWAEGFMQNFGIHDYRVAASSDKGPTAIYIPFSLYELDSRSDKQATLLGAVETIHANGRDGGIVAVLDDIKSIDEVYSPDIAKRRQRSIKYPTTCIWLYDSKQPELGFQRPLYFESGRCLKASFEPALIRQLARIGIEAL